MVAHIISNPPYKIGNKVIKTALPLAKEAVVLSPISKFYKDDIYKNITDLEFVDEESFDAVITKNLCVGVLKKDIQEPLFKDKRDLEMLSFEKKYLPAYKYNMEHNVYWKTSSPHSTDMVNKDTDFYFRARGMAMGVIKNQTGPDYLYNVGDAPSNTIPMAVNSKDSVFTHIAGYIIRFKTKEEKQNLCDFYYRNGGRNLMNELLLGMNKNDGTPFYAIPHVDWTRKWSDDEMKKELGIL